MFADAANGWNRKVSLGVGFTSLPRACSGNRYPWRGLRQVKRLGFFPSLNVTLEFLS
jgi:hypothetical protein